MFNRFESRLDALLPIRNYRALGLFQGKVFFEKGLWQLFFDACRLVPVCLLDRFYSPRWASVNADAAATAEAFFLVELNGRVFFDAYGFDGAKSHA